MKRLSILARCGLGLVGLAASAFALTAQAGDQDFTLVNDTNVEIHELYASPHETNNWEEDILGENTLVHGASVNISFSPAEPAAMWDLKVVDGEGNSIMWESLNLLEISEVTLHYENGKAWADLE